MKDLPFDLGFDGGCLHLKLPKPTFKDRAGMTAEDVRREFPRFDLVCQDCGHQVILYASFQHYIAGDW